MQKIRELQIARHGKCYIGTSQMTLLKYPFPLTQTRWGIAVHFEPIKEAYLEKQRKSKVSFNYQFRLYILKKCTSPMCSIFHGFIGEHFLTPTLMLTSDRFLQVQVLGTAWDPMAFATPWRVPIECWLDVTWTQIGRTLVLKVTYSDPKKGQVVLNANHIFENALKLDDTDGQYFIGGSKGRVRKETGLFG